MTDGGWPVLGSEIDQCRHASQREHDTYDTKNAEVRIEGEVNRVHVRGQRCIRVRLEDWGDVNFRPDTFARTAKKRNVRPVSTGTIPITYRSKATIPPHIYN